jgi:uncharacterized caspase-like protein
MYALPTLFLTLVLAAGLAQGQPEKSARVALVIGNGKYAMAPLPNPTNDAADMAKALEAAGFTVIRRENATLKEMVLALREFGDRLGRNSTGVFYFAGHGLQVRGRNYLVPVDADIAREDEVAFASLDLAAVMEKLDSARNPVNLVILDACRNNPFGTRLQLAQQGLAQVDAPPGTLIAFATAPGSVAADGGNGRNGLYTRHLLEQMRKPGAAVEEVLKATRAGVRKESSGRQIPWESTSLETHFTFHAPAPAPVPRKVTVAQAPRTATEQRSRSIAPSAPPALAPGDTWTYRVRDQTGQGERTRNVTIGVTDIRGTEVHWRDGARSDLLGNFKRVRRKDEWRAFTPSAHLYVFPLNEGSKFTLAAVEQVEGIARSYQLDIGFVVMGEEDVDTPAGSFRAVKIVRTVKWTHREKPQESGLNTFTYWYSGQVKRWVAQDQVYVAKSGKETLRERWELESYSVK